MCEENVTKKRCFILKTLEESAMLKKFCPLSRRTCRKDCMAFRVARFDKITPDPDPAVVDKPKYNYHSPYCASPVIDGVIYVEHGNSCM